MSNRFTPEDADLLARAIVTRLARLLVGIALTLFGLWLLPVLTVTSLTSATSMTQPDPARIVVAVLSLAAVAPLVFAGVTVWSGGVRPAPHSCDIARAAG